MIFNESEIPKQVRNDLIEIAFNQFAKECSYGFGAFLAALTS